VARLGLGLGCCPLPLLLPLLLLPLLPLPLLPLLLLLPL